MMAKSCKLQGGWGMKITTKLTWEYIKKNKRRSMATIIRYSYCNSTSYNCSYTSFKLPRIYVEYR